MKKKNNKGFSLIELIIAIAILVILTGLLAPQFMRYMEKSREAKDMQALDTVYGAVQTALANEDAYKAVQEATTGTLSSLKTTGASLTDVLADKTAFGNEVNATIGSKIEWSSKAVINAGKSGAVFVAINPTNWKVTVWIGDVSIATDGTVDEILALDSDGTKGDAANKTAGTKFYITK